MKKITLLTVVAALAVAVSAPAQVVIEARLGHAVRGTVVLDSHRPHDHADDRGRRHRTADQGDRGRHHESRRHRRDHDHGHWQTVHEKVRVPGYWREEHVPPTYGWISDSCGHRRWGVVDPGGCRRVWVPPSWETRSRRVWVPC